MNQRRRIERQNKLTEIEIEKIKRRIESEVNIQNSQAESTVADVLVKKKRIVLMKKEIKIM